jgi:hypothetical protein
MLGNYRVATQLVASRVVLSSAELVRAVTNTVVSTGSVDVHEGEAGRSAAGTVPPRMT